MKDDLRKLLLLNRLRTMESKPELASHDFPTHVHMSWPGFYDSVSHLSEADTLTLVFNDNVAFDNSGVLLNISSMPNSRDLENFQGGPNDTPHSIH
ncbi:hypothetical protein LCGC14_2081110 [marine sediment metagenome]|uniref:Uncharacterized protein n=1 Tax=marine sediment metagenome TaxID=412755 RepID=A0A0F9GTY8_9ZZZZ